MDPPAQKQRKGAGAVGGVLVALGALAIKFKALLAGIWAIKWLFVVPKLLISFGSMFLSVLVYAALFGGWKIAIVFVLMMLVHELGHYVTWRNFGVKTSLPMFIPGFGAFVASEGGTPAQNAAAALAGPAFGVAAAAACWFYGVAGHGSTVDLGHRFWLACAYIGFFINLFNLLPVPPFDGGAVAGAIDARLWFVGVVLVALWVLFVGVSTFGIIILILLAVTAVPRIVALWRGQIDPRGSGLTTAQRWMTLGAYVALIMLAIAGAAGTYIERTGA